MKDKLLQKAISYSKKAQNLIKKYEGSSFPNDQCIILLGYDALALQTWDNELFTVESPSIKDGIKEVSAADIMNDLAESYDQQDIWFSDYKTAKKVADKLLKRSKLNTFKIIFYSDFWKIVNDHDL